MATFGPIASANPNVLFDPARAIGAAQDLQRNQLMMENAKQDQAAQTFERDANARIALARKYADAPDDVPDAEWTADVQRLNQAGLGHGIDPTKKPPRERLRQIAASDLTTFQRLQLEEKRRSSEAMMALLGGGAPAAASVPSGPVEAPVRSAGAGPLAGPIPPAGSIPPPGDPGRNAALQAQRDALLDADPATLAAASAARGATGAPQIPGGYRAPDGVAGQYAGLPPPSGVINASVGGAAPAAAGPAVGPNGLTAEQTRILAVQAQTNPGSVPAMMSQFRQQNAMAGERAGDNARADATRQDALRHQRVVEERAAETLRLQQDAARRAGIPAGWEADPTKPGGVRPMAGGPADPSAAAAVGPSATDRTKLKQAETDAAAIITALDAFKDRRAKAGPGERIGTALGMSTVLGTTYNNAALLAKGEALYNLGVLNGADLTRLQQALADPGTLKGGLATSQETVDGQIDAVKALLQSKLETARQQFGGQAPAAGGGGGQRRKVASPDEARKLPSGTLIELPDGSPGVVP
jgi:hypothetical protein